MVKNLKSLKQLPTETPYERSTTGTANTQFRWNRIFMNI